MSTINAIRGMNDILPNEIPYWHRLEAILQQLLTQHGYQEIRFPIVEQSQLFHRSVGDTSDIVEKETYDFKDRNGSDLTLRPEGTAGCVRAVIQNGMARNQQLHKLWYIGPMFRHERPQKGRYRQFHQLGVEIYGLDQVSADAELIALTWQLWQQLGLSEDVTLQINTLGTQSERQTYQQALVTYLEAHYDALDTDSQRRLYKNPLRILDSKNPELRPIIEQAPRFSDHLGPTSTQQFQQLTTLIEQLGIPYEINPYLVRGLDYYNHTVFEWVTSALGAQGTICAGGRYDQLVEQLGGASTPATGFAIGLERLILLLQMQDKIAPTGPAPDVYIVSDAPLAAMPYAAELRCQYPHLTIVQHLQEGSFKSQFKKANKANATLALILGQDERAQQQVTIKFLQADSPQVTMSWPKLIDQLACLLN